MKKYVSRPFVYLVIASLELATSAYMSIRDYEAKMDKLEQKCSLPLPIMPDSRNAS